jgi:M6 family metalloprotease-like protein
MKTKIILSGIFILLFLLFFRAGLNAQNECGTEDPPPGSQPYSNNFIGGYYKPERTDLNNGNPSPSWANFNMLFVFIQFPDETTNADFWPIGYPPVYMDKFLVKDKNDSGPFWNNYRDSSLSDYYQEVSRGAFHVNGEARHIIMNNNWSFYQTYGYNVFLTEIYTKLKNDPSITWPKFDQWSRNDVNNRYMLTKDKYLDMIGLFIRHVIGTDFTSAPGAAGYVPLGGPFDFVVYANGNDTIKINGNRSKFGSGFVVKGNNGPLHYTRSLGIAIHEYGHYLFANNHSYSGIMTSNGGISLNDLFMSGYEKYKLGYSDVATVDFENQNIYSLGEISGRYGTPHLLKVPISSTDFFIIENRRKVSRYDVYMLGDTSQNDPFRNTGDYGKGIYITHNNNIGLNYAGEVDIECADGLWNWSYFGTTTPDWSSEQQVAVWLRTSIPSTVSNDWGNFYNSFNSDGVSMCSWFSIGKRHTQIGQPGIDRIYTNADEYWTSREIWGDRWDAWNIGYNEIFSPYSNPNTKSHNNIHSGIHIWYKNFNSTTKDATIEIYRADLNSEYENEVLEIMPPSRPMGIKNTYVPDNTLENIVHPKISWNHNTEPDMLRDNGKKMYIVYRALADNMNQLPGPYYVRAALEIDANSPAEYVDLQIIGEPSELYGQEGYEPFPLRYRVVAVDKHNDYSVPSDFATAKGLKPEGSSIDPGSGDKISSNNGLPKEYNLFQNYPNPFNPVTNIQYDLPKEGLVSLKVYDLLGREVKSLVNEFKQAGSYIVSFDGSELSSGIYFYRLESGNFVQVKRMVLIK